jgi:transposase
MELDSRKQKGLEMAATMRLRRKGSIWSVPSQSGKGDRYQVDVKAENPTCTCSDYETNRVKCKHIYAVELTRLREVSLDGEQPVAKFPRPTYSQNWPAYNAAQCNEKKRVPELLRGLCDGIEQPLQGRGRPRLPLADAVFCAIMKVYSGDSGRRAATDLQECQELGYIDKAPHYNSIFNYLEDPALTPILKMLIEESATPLKAIESDFAVDSSGFSTSTYERWFDAKYGKMKTTRYWVKAHLMIGVQTNVVTAVEVTGPEANDYPFLPSLLETTSRRFNVVEVSADKGYMGKSNLQAIVKGGATPYIPFKANTTGEGPELWRRLYHFYKFSRPEFLEKYHKRSNVEATFSMIKAKFGAAVRSKTPTAQMNEVLGKIICHNLCCLVHSIYELNIAPVFWEEDGNRNIALVS